MPESPRFLLVLRARSGLYWPQGESFTISGYPTQHGRVDVLFQTHRATLAGFTRPLARGIHVEVAGPAPSLAEAIPVFAAAAEVLTPLLSIAHNAPIGILEAELAYEITPGQRERPYFQQFFPDPSPLPLEPRYASSLLIKSLASALHKAPDNDKTHRAIVYYHQAFLTWRPEADVQALAYLYMGVEALTPVVLRKHLSDTGCSKDELVRAWGIEKKQLDAEVRRRLIFLEDDALYKAAKRVSDGFEHGFAPFTELREAAGKVFLPLARVLRSAILAHSGLTRIQLCQYFTPELNEPFALFHTKVLFGTLRAPSDELSAPDQLYPYLQWRSKLVERPIPADGDPAVDFTENMHLVAAPGVTINEIKVRAITPRTKPIAAGG